VAAPVGGRLYLPQSWIDDPQRRAKAGVPSDVSFATKNEIALTLIQEALADQVVQAPVLADAAYGNSYAFRAHLRELNLEFFVLRQKNFWSDVGEDPGSDPAVAAEIDRGLSLLPVDIPGEDR